MQQVVTLALKKSSIASYPVVCFSRGIAYKTNKRAIGSNQAIQHLPQMVVKGILTHTSISYLCEVIFRVFKAILLDHLCHMGRRRNAMTMDTLTNTRYRLEGILRHTRTLAWRHQVCRKASDDVQKKSFM